MLVLFQAFSETNKSWLFWILPVGVRGVRFKKQAMHVDTLISLCKDRGSIPRASTNLA